MKILDVQPTPNPDAIKVVVDVTVAPIHAPISAGSHPDHPLIQNLAVRESVADVLLQGSEVTIVFDPEVADDGRTELRWVGSRLRAFDSQDLLTYETPEGIVTDDPTILLIRDVLETEILPYLRSHGGSASVIGLDGNEVLLRYLGACGGCPASLGGTLDAIEGLIQKEVDPDLKIRLV